MIKYSLAPDIDTAVRRMAEKLDIRHDMSRIVCIRSKGSSSKRTLARCHALPRVMQVALNAKAHYVIEVISENFDKLTKEEKTKILIHELLHIPKAFGGGFKYHNYVNKHSVEEMYKKFLK